MNPDSGHLIDRTVLDDYELRRRGLDPRAYVKVPPKLESAAQAKLAGTAEAIVSRNSGGMLSRWAAEQRRLERKRREKAKRRRRTARESRRRNRRPRR